MARLRSTRSGAAPRRAAGRVALCAVALAGLLAACSSPAAESGTHRPGTANGPQPAASPTEHVTPRSGPAETRRGVRYAPGSAPRQTLDLYLPEGDGSTVRPIVLLVHGGGFRGGDAADLTGRAHLLASKGFAVASVNYRLSTDAPFPAGVDDVKAAVRYVRAHAPEWGVDPGRIGVWGESAGGYLADMLAVTGDDAFHDGALGNAGTSSAVRAVVSWFGPVDFTTMDDQAREAGCRDQEPHSAPGSPESQWLGAPLEHAGDRLEQSNVLGYVREGGQVPPLLLVHGKNDCTVPLGQSEQFRQALEDHGHAGSVRLTVVDDAGHMDQKIVEGYTKPTVQFLRDQLMS